MDMTIEVKNMTKRFGPTTVLDKINIELHSGVAYGFQGINGCGKTMLMRLIAGLVHPTEGSVLVNGKELRGQNSFPENMGLLIENPSFLSNYSGYENLKMLASIKDCISADEVKDALRRVGLNPDDKKKYRKYSLGMKQRLGIACAIMEKPDLLILDEPLISLDEDGIAATKQIVQEEKARGAIVILACHDYDSLVAMTDEIFRITAGRITKHLINTADGTFCEAE